MPFTDPVVADTTLVRDAIQSPDYVAGTSGWTINRDGSAEFANATVRGTIESSTITVSGDASLIQAVDSDGLVVASIDSTGTISGARLTIAGDDGDVEIGGRTLEAMLASNKTPWLAYGRSTVTRSAVSAETGLFEIAFEAPETKNYVIEASTQCWLTGNNGLVGLLVRDGGSSKPSTSSPIVLDGNTAGSNWGTGFHPRAYGVVQLTAGTHRLLLSAQPYVGAPMTVTGPSLMTVSHFDETLTNLAVDNNGGGGSSAPVQTYTTQWGATWSGSYGGDNAYNSFYGNEVHQGYYSSSEGNQRGLIGFDSASIMAALSGATILSCTVTLYAFHWYANAGGTAVLGTHGHSSRPGTFSASTNRLQSGGWPKPGLRTVDLGTGIGGEFKSGATKGVALGPGPSTSTAYYGKFSGVGMSNAPVLTITYQK